MQPRPQTGRTDGMPRESFGHLLSALANHSAVLVRDEMALAKQELKESARSLGRGVTMVAIGAIVGLIALAALSAAAVIWLTHFMAAGYAALIVGIVLAAFSAGAALSGINRLKRTSLAPEQTIKTLEENGQWLKELI